MCYRFNMSLRCKKRQILDQRKVYISPFCQLQCTFKTFFLLQLYKFLFVFFVSTRENVVMLWIQKKQNEIKCETTLKYFRSQSPLGHKNLFITVEGILEKSYFGLILVNLQFLSNKHTHLSHFISFMHGNMRTNNI